MDSLLDVLRALRAPDGCPWDREQTHESLRPHLLEEAAEAVDAIGTGEDAAMIEELGDVLLHVGFHAVIAEEEGRWTLDDVERTLVEKLIRRHPHVFGDERAKDVKDVEQTWARVKQEEKQGRREHPADRVPDGLPALARAAAVGDALAWTESEDAVTRVAEGATDAETLADAFISLAMRAARGGHHPELLVRDAIAHRAAYQRQQEEGSAE